MMILNEIKIFFSNIKNLRHLLKEGVGENDIVNAIQKHEYIYIYYAGDNTIERGYRTIRPFVLGTSTAGNKVLRAWQDKGKSDSLRADSPRKRPNHEYHRDNDGKEKAGWRLFIVDKISSAYPTGKRFVDEDGNVMIPPLYNQNDKQMTNIIASVSPKEPKSVQTKGLGKVAAPSVVATKVDKSQFDTQTNKFKKFYNAGKQKRDATAKDIQNLYDVAKRVMKKSPDRYLVAIDKKGDFNLVDIAQKDKLPPEAIVGKLTNLYDKLVRTAKTTVPAEQSFIKQQKDSVMKKQPNINKNSTMVKENEKNLAQRKTFFKQ
jgi:hypothetical protein